MAKIADFTHLTEPDGTVYPHLLADALTALALALGLGVDKARPSPRCSGSRQVAIGFRPSPAAHESDGGIIRFVDDSKA